MTEAKTQILNNLQIEQKINRISYQIYENNHLETEIVIAGIIGNGDVLSKKIVKKLSEISDLKITTCTISLNKTKPLSEPVTCDIHPDELTNKVIVIVDDVLDSGRTLIYGVRYFLDFPVKAIKTVVLVDRSHRSFPIKADHVGISLATTLQEHIRVYFEGESSQAILM